MTSDTQKALVIAAMLGALFFLARQPKPDAPVGNDYPDAMVVVPPVGMGASTQLDAWADENNVELRRYTEQPFDETAKLSLSPLMTICWKH